MRPCLARLAGGLLDPAMKPGVAEHLIQVQSFPNAVDRLSLQLGEKKPAIRRLPLLRRRAKRRLHDAWRDARIRLARRVDAIADPAIEGWIDHHRRPHRVELDISLAHKQIKIGLDQ